MNDKAQPSNQNTQQSSPDAAKVVPKDTLATTLADKALGSINTDGMTNNIGKAVGGLPLVGFIPESMRTQFFSNAAKATGVDKAIDNTGKTVKENALPVVTDIFSNILSLIRPLLDGIMNMLPESVKNAFSGVMGMVGGNAPAVAPPPDTTIAAAPAPQPARPAPSVSPSSTPSVPTPDPKTRTP